MTCDHKLYSIWYGIILQLISSVHTCDSVRVPCKDPRCELSESLIYQAIPLQLASINTKVAHGSN